MTGVLPPRSQLALGRPAAGPETVRERVLDLGLPAPSPGLQAVVAVPARDEAARLPALVAALAGQTDTAGRPLAPGLFEAIVLVNNSADGSAEAARRAAQAFPHLTLHVAEVTLGPREAHVGRARQIALDAAWGRLALADGGLLLTTDADTRPAPDWLARTAAELRGGADAVGGRILLDPAERAALPPRLRRLVLLDAGYRRALEHVRHLVAPDDHDPYPRHHQHFGGSLGVTAAAYARAGGIPAVAALEDLAFVDALRATGARLRHSDAVRVWTSARRAGRAADGLACEMARWERLSAVGRPLVVESAAHAGARLVRLGRYVRDHGGPPPRALAEAPWPIPTHAGDEVGRALAGLRLLASRLAALPLHARLAEVPVRSSRPARLAA